MSDPIIQIDDATFAVGAATLVDSVSLEIARGSIVAICGPNGAGAVAWGLLVCGREVYEYVQTIIDGHIARAVGNCTQNYFGPKYPKPNQGWLRVGLLRTR